MYFFNKFPLTKHLDRRFQLSWNLTQIGLIFFTFIPSIGAVLLSLALLYIYFIDYRSIISRPINWGLAILSLLLIISAGFAMYPVEAFLGLANFLPFFIFFIGLNSLVQTPNQARQISWILVINSIIVIIIGFGQLFLGWSGSSFLENIIGSTIPPTGNPPGRMSSIFMHANILAAYLCITLTLALGLWCTAYQNWRSPLDNQNNHNNLSRQILLFLTFTIILNIIAIILTNSRNAWVIAFLACFTFAIYQGWRLLVAGITVITGSIIWSAYGPNPLREWLRAIIPAYFWARLTDELNPNRPLADMRSTQWNFAWKMIQQRPLHGWGLRNFSPLYKSQWQMQLNHPHNLFIMLTSETGIPATLLFLIIVGYVITSSILLWRDWVGNNQDKLIFFSYLIAFFGCIIFNLIDVTIFDLRINTLGWLLLSNLAGLSRYQVINHPKIGNKLE